MENSWNHLHPLSKWSFLTCSDRVLQLSENYSLSLCNKLNSVHNGIQHRYVLMINVTIVILRTMWLCYFKWWTHNWKASYRLLTIYNRYKFYYTFNWQSGMFFIKTYRCWIPLWTLFNLLHKERGDKNCNNQYSQMFTFIAQWNTINNFQYFF
jgi:hypothetical protein